MREPNIKELLKLYEEGKATEQQRQLVEKFLGWHQDQSPEQEMNAAEGDDSLREILDKIQAARERDSNEAPIYHIEPKGGAEGFAEEESLKSGKYRHYGWAAAAVIVLAVGGLLWKINSRQPEAPQVAVVYKTIEARPGETIHLLLSDSSEVWLNAGSRLRYPQPFGDSVRKLELLDGEAFFQVHPDAGRRFVVKTDKLLTTVLGTSFNIKSYRGSQQLSVSVTTGKVSVATANPASSPTSNPASNPTSNAASTPAPNPASTTAPNPAENLVLTAHQQANYNNVTTRLTRSVFASDHILDWKSGSFSFMEESLGDIAIELEHYYNVRIDFKHPGLRKYLVSASFSHQTPVKEILNTLCLLNQNHVTQTDAQHYVIH